MHALACLKPGELLVIVFVEVFIDKERFANKEFLEGTSTLIRSIRSFDNGWWLHNHGHTTRRIRRRIKNNHGTRGPFRNFGHNPRLVHGHKITLVR